MGVRDEVERLLRETIETSVVVVSTGNAYRGKLRMDVLEDFSERDRWAMLLAMWDALQEGLLLVASEIDDLHAAVGPDGLER